LLFVNLSFFHNYMLVSIS